MTRVGYPKRPMLRMGDLVYRHRDGSMRPMKAMTNYPVLGVVIEVSHYEATVALEDPVGKAFGQPTLYARQKR